MRQAVFRCIVTIAIGGALPATAVAQGRGGSAWTTVGGDAQRSASVRTDPRITKESVAKSFQLLWKIALDNPSKRPNALTQPVLLPNIISYKGFKALAFVGGTADNVYAIDYDLSRPFWHRTLENGAAPATAECPGLTTITRATPSMMPGGGRGGRGQGPGGGRAGQGPPPNPPMPGSGPGPNAVLGGRGGNNNVYAISSGGKLYALNAQDGTDMVPPIPFLPANARAVGSILIDTVLYAATTSNCGGAPNALWAIELANDANTVRKWEAGDLILGDGPSFGLDGTIYVTTSKEIVALAPKTLEVKARSTGVGPFTSSAAIFQLRDKNYVAAGARGSLVSLIDQGTSFTTVTTPLAKASGDVTAVATARDETARYLFASATSGSGGSIAAFTIADQSDSAMVQPAWVSRDLASPATPLVINGVVFALSGGERSQPGSRPAVLYALDAATGKELWNSGSSIASPVRGVGPSGGDGQVYVVTSDGTMYCFGIPVER